MSNDSDTPTVENNPFRAEDPHNQEDTTLSHLASDVRALTAAVRHLVWVLSPTQVQVAAQGQLKLLASLATACANLGGRMAEISAPTPPVAEMDLSDMMKMAGAFGGISQ